MNNDELFKVRMILSLFQDAYTARDLAKVDEFMQLFCPGDEPELIGIGASERDKDEWFQGQKRIREIVISDWQHWGDVRLDVENARINVNRDVAWLSTTGSLLQTDHIQGDEVTSYTLTQMKNILEDQQLSPRARLVEASHFGVRRWRERQIPVGHPWPFVFTAVLVKHNERWLFHTIHWSMPVD